MIRRLFFAAVAAAAFASPGFAQGTPGATPNPPAQPNVHRPDQWPRNWNTNAFNGSGTAHPENGTGGSVAGHGNTNAFNARPANHANSDAFGTTAFGHGDTNAFGRNNAANDNANRMAGSFPTQNSHGRWFETGPNPPAGPPRQ